MSTPLADPHLLAQVDGAALELLAAAGCGGPPVDALQLAQEHLRLVICVDRRMVGRGRAQRLPGGVGQICVRPDDRPERRQWTVAHEIAEQLQGWLRDRCGLGPDDLGPAEAEQLANLFAERLLVPTAWLKAEVRRVGWDLFALKALFATASHEVIAFRLLDLPGGGGIVTVLDHGHVTRRRGRPWPAPRWLLPGERRCQIEVHDRGVPLHLKADAYEVWGWPIHEVGWKRDILRTVLTEEG
jgi:hypothetical protein